MRHQRWVVLSFVTAAILVGMTVQSASVSAFAQFAIPDKRFGPMTTTGLLALVAGGVTFALLIRNPRAVTFTAEVVDELSKVTWPSKDETIRATTTVVVTTAIVSGLLGVYDFVWKNLADLFLLTSSG